jgi:hypothetical protein
MAFCVFHKQYTLSRPNKSISLLYIYNICNFPYVYIVASMMLSYIVIKCCLQPYIYSCDIEQLDIKIFKYQLW